MSIISLNSVNKRFGTQPVLKDVGFSISSGDKIGLVGQNGTGKSTILNIMYGLETTDSGEITGLEDWTVGYMTQDSKLDGSKTLKESASSPTGQLGSLKKKINYLEQKLEKPELYSQEELDSLSKEYAKFLEDFAQSGGYGHPAKAEGILDRLGFTKWHYNTKVADLSGGERTKARLVNIILEAEDSDLLLLDEPTNHLDIETTEWLEDYLSRYPGAILMVSHDRYLLDKIVNKIVEIEGFRTKTYAGNYSDFLKKKTEELETHQSQYKKQQKEIRRQKEMIQFMHSVYHYKSIHKTKQKALERMEKVDRPVNHAKKLSLDFGKAEKGGRDMIDAKAVTKAYGQTTIIGKCEFSIMKGDKIGLIGPNGSGKTTLIRMIMGEEQTTSGDLKVTKGTSIGYYDQEHDGLIRSNTVIQEIRKEKKNASEEWVRNFLGGFFFRGDEVYKKVFQLSGGERARLAIAKLLLAKHNMLILDEPTNYLDMYAKAAVEQALMDYEGTIMVISHDRALLDTVVDRIFDLREAALKTYAGNFTSYRRQLGASKLSTDGSLYEVKKTFKDWKTKKKYQQGEILKIREGDLPQYEWAVNNKYLVKKK